MKIPNYDIEIEEKFWNNIINEHQTKNILPKLENIFLAFELTPIEKVKVVIIGQDPYPNQDHAMGLAFSSKSSQTPASLKNIFKEILSSEKYLRTQNDLSDWAKQGVLLMNSSLTVIEKKPNSHNYINWAYYTDQVIKKISSNKNNVVFILLGNFAASKRKIINESKHHVIVTSHPSPLSSYRGFNSSEVFKRCNDYLVSNNKKPIK